MSKFVTRIPVDVEAVKALLPKGSFLERVSWNGKTSEVEVQWDHERFYSGADYHLPFGVELLEGKKLPKGVRDGGPPPKKKPAAPKPKKSAKPRSGRALKSFRSEETETEPEEHLSKAPVE
jgi:hypothetical protein